MTMLTLGRACEAARIPGGEKVTLPAGTLVELVQSLGGYTVKTEGLGMLRIESADAGALGLPAQADAQRGEGVRLSEFAVRKLRELMETEGKTDYGVRVSALSDGKGSHTHQMDFEKEPAAVDVAGEQHGLRVFYSKEEADLIEGVLIDYRESSQGSGFVMRAPKKPSSGPGLDAPEGSLERRAWDALRACYDPEIPINIVDLGLIYALKLEPLPEGGYEAEVEMTLTAPGCSMGDVLREDVRQKLLGLPGVKRVEVQLVFDPPWSKDRMSESARLQLDI